MEQERPPGPMAVSCHPLRARTWTAGRQRRCVGSERRFRGKRRHQIRSVGTFIDVIGLSKKGSPFGLYSLKPWKSAINCLASPSAAMEMRRLNILLSITQTGTRRVL